MGDTIALEYSISQLSDKSRVFMRRAAQKLGGEYVEQIDEDKQRIYLRSTDNQFVLFARTKDEEVIGWYAPDILVTASKSMQAEEAIDVMRQMFEGWVHSGELIADWRGGVREGAGRPKTEHRERKVMLSDVQWEFARYYGGGNASLGVRRLIDSRM